MSAISSKLRRWRDDQTGNEGLTYWCQGCGVAHGVRIKGSSAWSWNGDLERPVFSPSVLSRGIRHDMDEATQAAYDALGPGELRAALDDPRFRTVCHTFVGCNGAQPGEVIFLSDCTHALAGTVQPFPDLPEWLR